MTLPQAIAALRDGRPADAERICRGLLVQAPAYWAAALALTDALLAQGRLRAANRLTADLLLRNPEQPDLLAARGATLARFEALDEAISLLDRAIEIRLEHERAHEILATLLERRGDPRPRYEVSVITPSVGTAFLRQAVESVQRQTYPFVRHFVVADGPECLDRVAGTLSTERRHPIHLLPLPLNVGADGFHGHRVYAALPFLVPSRFVAFLDEDNWMADDHLETLMALVTARGLTWAHSLRGIMSPEGEAITTDDCESLGRWPTWNNPQLHHVDTNCYLLRRDVAMATATTWYRRYPRVEGPDFALCRRLLAEQPRFATTGRYTLHYRAGRSPHSVRPEFFLRGNQVTRRTYGTNLPWRAADALPETPKPIRPGDRSAMAIPRAG